jgi:hypothetical protein
MGTLEVVPCLKLCKLKVALSCTVAMNFSEMGPRPKLRPKKENHWPTASDAMFDHFKELKVKFRHYNPHPHYIIP